MSDPFKSLGKATKLGTGTYSETYISNLKGIISKTSSPKVMKSRLQYSGSIEKDILLRCSLMFNDLTLLNWQTRCENSITILETQFFKDQFGIDSIKITVPNAALHEFGLNTDQFFRPALVFPREYKADKALRSLKPFIGKGKILLEPRRYVFYQDSSKQDGIAGQLVPANLDSPISDWQISGEDFKPPLPITFEPAREKEKKLFEVTIPYLEGVKFKDLFKILEDEEDLISALRVSLLEAISKNPEKEAALFARDVIDPQVDKINRSLRKLVNSKSIRIAGAGVGAITLACTASFTAGMAAVMATAASGTAGFGLLSNEYANYREERNALEENPYYLLWRCKQLKRRI